MLKREIMGQSVASLIGRGHSFFLHNHGLVCRKDIFVHCLFCLSLVFSVNKNDQISIVGNFVYIFTILLLSLLVFVTWPMAWPASVPTIVLLHDRIKWNLESIKDSLNLHTYLCQLSIVSYLHYGKQGLLKHLWYQSTDRLGVTRDTTYNSFSQKDYSLATLALDSKFFFLWLLFFVHIY